MLEISSGMVQRTLIGTVLKSVGSFARLGDLNHTGNKEVITAGVKRETSLLAFTAMVSFGLEALMKQMKPQLKALPFYQSHNAIIKAFPVFVGYLLAEGASKRFAGLGKEFQEMANHNTVNVNLGEPHDNKAKPSATGKVTTSINFKSSASMAPVVLQANPVNNPFTSAASVSNSQYNYNY